MKFLLILLLTLFVLRYLLPLVLRLVVGNVVRKQMQKHGFTPPVAGPPPAPGQVRVDYVPPQASEPRPQGFKGGEYVEFEEVK